MQLTSSENFRVTKDSDNNRSIVIDSDNNIYVAFYTSVGQNNYYSYFKWYDMKAGSWSSEILLSVNSSDGKFPTLTIVPAHGSTNEQVWFAWMDKRSGQRELRYRVWDTGTKTWASGFSTDSQTLSEEGGYQLSLNYQTNYGMNFAVSQDGGTVYAFWCYEATHDLIYYRVFTDGAWGSETPYSDPNGWFTRFPSAVMDKDGNVYLTYVMALDDEREENYVYFDKFDIAESQWTEPYQVYRLGHFGAEGCPTLRIDNDDDLHLAFWSFRYYGQLGNIADIYYAGYDGSSWDDVTIVTGHQEDAEYPTIDLVDGHPWIFWQDGRDIRIDTAEIYYRYFNGSQWSDQTRLTNNSAHSSKPVAAFDTEGNVHVVWNDYRADPVQVYYNFYDIEAPSAPQNLSVTGTGQYQNPLVTWTSSSSKDVTSYKIYRNNSLIGSVNAYSTSFVDGDVSLSTSGSSYTYTAKALDAAENLSPVSNSVTVNGFMMKARLVSVGIPTSYELGAAFPNPFNPSTEIGFGMPRAETVQLKIFNLQGQLIAILHDGFLEAGYHQIPWNGKNRIGRQVSSGLYLYRLETSGFKMTKTMTLLK